MLNIFILDKVNNTLNFWREKLIEIDDNLVDSNMTLASSDLLYNDYDYPVENEIDCVIYSNRSSNNISEIKLLQLRY